MFKRAFWLTVGFGSGIGTSWYVARSVKRTVRRTVAAYPASEVATRAATAAARGLRTFGGDVRGAIAEGRVAMREREAELRAEMERRRTGATADPADPAVRGAVAATATSQPVVVEVPDELAQWRNRTHTDPVGRARAGR
ncbi:MAG TPA: hypothetical protein VFC33_12995 [Acidimicrobiia bacterium]|nr:hypothetical protein [Acidimicrobiia bacterium]